MHITKTTLLALQACIVLALPGPSPAGPHGLDAKAQLKELAKGAYEKAKEDSSLPSHLRSKEGTCSWKGIKIRREWGAFSKQEKLDYIKAVKCLMSKPPNYPQSMVPGARSRFDDFLAVHINQTLIIHSTGNFLSWHRYYTWLYEEALKKECGYKGTQPWWDWALTGDTGFDASPIFDGSESSLSGNGLAIPNQEPIKLIGDNNTANPPIILPPGSGGGCITSGPFKNMSLNLGPVALDAPGGVRYTAPTGNPLDYNPRCLKRDLTDEIIRTYVNANATLNNIIQAPDIATFQSIMQGPVIDGKKLIGIHGGGHFSLGGDPARDLYTSPGDPVFYFNHAAIDRVWWIWQMQDEKSRVWESTALSGTNTYRNKPPSANTTLEDWIELSYAAGPPRQIKELMSTRFGPFCYVYV
ncbi:tyrosinase [Rhypophila decipiens]|uniref:Tyrosinase n=1 Tax=Rhypophila decipiens TaxID=261697 RepID=A0AAN6XX37_9PEZI|nr:tyrosinase [Rhypophila decipiens]